MIIRSACAALCILATTLCNADDTEPKRWQQLRDALANARPFQTAQAQFTQEKSTPLLRQPITTHGKVRLAQGTLRFDTTEPYQTVMLIKGSTLTLYDPDAQSAEQLNLTGPMLQLGDGLRFNPDTMQEQWSLASLDQTPDTLTLTLQPRTEVPSSNTPLLLTLNPNSGFAEQLTLPGSPDETTRLIFTDVQLNVPITAEDLSLHLPEGVTVTTLDANAGAGATP